MPSASFKISDLADKYVFLFTNFLFSNGSKQKESKLRNIFNGNKIENDRVDGICQLSKMFNSKIDLPMSWVLTPFRSMCFFNSFRCEFCQLKQKEEQNTRAIMKIKMFSLSFLACVCVWINTSIRIQKKNTRTENHTIHSFDQTSLQWNG